MSYITLKCKNCGANMSLNTQSHSATCTHCGSTFLIADLLDEKDALFVEKFTPQNIEEKMMAQEALKQGETYLFQANFNKAELSFKRAIELDENNFKGYLGVVKAKTNNLNILPENDDYIQYAHYALDLAKGDDHVFVKNELAKIKLLKRERIRQKKTKLEHDKQEELLKRQKQGFSKITTSLVIFAIVTFLIFICLGTKSFINIFSNKGSAKTINIDSYSKLQTVFSSDKYLGYNINLSCDIDCENNELSPLGTARKPFKGTFNGNKHKISNALIKASTEDEILNYIGMFGYTKRAIIHDLILDGIIISTSSEAICEGSTQIGLLAGKVESTTISNVEIKRTCKINLNNNFDYNLSVGGVVGSAVKSSNLSLISSHAEISVSSTQNLTSANSYIGSVAGLSNSSTIEKTCSNSTITATLSNTTSTPANVYVSGIVGYIQNVTQKNLSKINHNTFSGSVNVTSNGYTCSVNAIAGSGLKSTSKQSNLCLVVENSFILSGENLLKTQLTDYDAYENFVQIISSSEQIYQNLASVFSTWKNTNSYEPNLI